VWLNTGVSKKIINELTAKVTNLQAVLTVAFCSLRFIDVVENGACHLFWATQNKGYDYLLCLRYLNDVKFS